MCYHCIKKTSDCVFTFVHYLPIVSVSLTNLVQLYNAAHVDDQNIPNFPHQPGFGPELSRPVCKDGLDINTLLFHAKESNEPLDVPESGEDVNRFKEAIVAHLSRVRRDGSSHRNHTCSACVRIIKDANGNEKSALLFLIVIRLLESG